MNTIKKMRAGMMMFALAIVLVFTQSAFKGARAPQTWVFTGSSIAQIHDADLYSQTAPQPSNCNTTRPLPCKVVLNDAIDTNEELQMFLDEKNDSQILSYAVGRRN